MKSYQDLQAIGESDKQRIDFVYEVIKEHENSVIFERATIADEYIRGQNREAKRYVKQLTTATGQKIEDKWTPNNKTTRNIFRRLVWEEVQYLLGNGVKWGKDDTPAKLGRDFDNRIREMARYAKQAAVCFGFYNLDHLEVFPIRTENGGFVPLYDLENGSLRSGIRFWRMIDKSNDKTVKTLRATLYEENGYTNMIWVDDGQGEIYTPKRSYTVKVKTSSVDGTEIYDGENYPSFPIVPMWGNSLKESELYLGIKDLIDAVDRLNNGYINDLDNAQIYWIIKNAGGMDNADIAKFLDQLRALQAAELGDGSVEPVTVNIPYAAREALIQRLENAIIDDYMGLNIREVVNGASTATQIRAAYEPVNTKSGDFEEQVLDFLYKILDLAGIDDTPTFEPIPIVNVTEETNNTLSALGAGAISREYATERILTLFGDVDRIAEVQAQLDGEDMQRIAGMGLEPTNEPQDEEESVKDENS